MNTTFLPPALQVKSLTKTYSNGFMALKDVHLRIEKGDFLALLGPNGAGKSTFINIVSSLTKKTAGDVQVLGHSLEHNAREIKHLMGVVPQDFNFDPCESVEDIILNQAGYYGLRTYKVAALAQQYMKRLNLWDKRNTPNRQLSGGMKRRLMVIRALIHKPKLLILDEPTSGVDIELRHSMWDFLVDINRQGTAIVLTTHYLEEAQQLCNKVVIVDRGEVIEDTTMALLLQKIEAQTYVLELNTALAHNLNIAGHKVIAQQGNTCEIAIGKGQSFNAIICHLEAQGIDVLSVRGKVNPLEKLFVALTSPKTPARL